MIFSHFYLLGTLFSNTNVTTDVAIYKPMNVINFLTTINEGAQLISDVCDDLDEKYSIINSNTKPNCYINISYINNDKFVVSRINEKIKTFFLEQKKEKCKNEQIECGEVMIIIKLLDLINNAIKLSMLSNNLSQLDKNLQIIDFYDKYITFKYSLTNIELLTNITLSKQKLNVILTREKTRLKRELNKASYDYITEFISTNIGIPLKNVFVYTGNIVGETFGETINNIIPSLTIEGKLIVFLGLIYLIKRC